VPDVDINRYDLGRTPRKNAVLVGLEWLQSDKNGVPDASVLQFLSARLLSARRVC
jgi:hypothetical protein